MGYQNVTPMPRNKHLNVVRFVQIKINGHGACDALTEWVEGKWGSVGCLHSTMQEEPAKEMEKLKIDLKWNFKVA